jgi:hypothetical protein
VMLPALRLLHFTHDCWPQQGSVCNGVSALSSGQGRSPHCMQGKGYAGEGDRYARDDVYSMPQQQQGAPNFSSGSRDKDPGSGRDDSSSQHGGSGSRQGSEWGRPVDYDAVEDW